MSKVEGAPQSSAFEIIDAKLQALQGPLSELVTQAGVVFEEVFPHAPHPLEVSREFPVYATQSENLSLEGIPKVRELTVRLSARDWLRVFKDSGTGYREMMIWANWPHGFNMRRAVIQQFPNEIDRRQPYDIDVANWDPTMNRYLKHVDDVLIHPERYLHRTQDQLDRAMHVAAQHVSR